MVLSKLILLYDDSRVLQFSSSASICLHLGNVMALLPRRAHCSSAKSAM